MTNPTHSYYRSTGTVNLPPSVGGDYHLSPSVATRSNGGLHAASAAAGAHGTAMAVGGVAPFALTGAARSPSYSNVSARIAPADSPTFASAAAAGGSATSSPGTITKLRKAVTFRAQTIPAGSTGGSSPHRGSVTPRATPKPIKGILRDDKKLEEANKILKKANRTLEEANRTVEEANQALVSEQRVLKQTIARLSRQLTSANLRLEANSNHTARMITIYHTTMQSMRGRANAQLDTNQKTIAELEREISALTKHSKQQELELEDKTAELTAIEYMKELLKSSTVTSASTAAAVGVNESPTPAVSTNSASTAAAAGVNESPTPAVSTNSASAGAAERPPTLASNHVSASATESLKLEPRSQSRCEKITDFFLQVAIGGAVTSVVFFVGQVFYRKVSHWHV